MTADLRRAERRQGPQGRTPKRSGGVDGVSTSRTIGGLAPGWVEGGRPRGAMRSTGVAASTNYPSPVGWTELTRPRISPLRETAQRHRADA
jgi:hypothetical protein